MQEVTAFYSFKSHVILNEEDNKLERFIDITSIVFKYIFFLFRVTEELLQPIERLDSMQI